MPKSASGSHHAEARTGRKLVEIAQVARGRTPLKYEFEVIPFFAAGELPSGLEKVCFTWERGSKLFSTPAEPVNPHTRAVFWQQFLKQTCTMYKEAGRILPKEFSFKIQNVRGSGEHAVKKTIGKIKVDMAQFCAADETAVPQEVYLQLKPAGKLKVSIKARWLKDAKVDEDALTELSFATHRSTEAGDQPEDGYEQDLSGFETAEEALAAHRVHSNSGASSSPKSRIPAYRNHADGSGSNSSSSSPTHGKGAAAALAAAAGVNADSPRSKAGSKLKPGVLQVDGSTAPFTVGLSPQAEAERAIWLAEERARQEAFQQAESAKLRRTIEDQLRVELNDVLAKSSFSWRDMFCCCLPKRAPQLRATGDVAMTGMRESSSQLLSAATLPL